MADPIIKRSELATLYDGAPADLDHDAKVQHVAGLWFVDPVEVESSLASRESAHTQAMECEG